MTYTYSGEDCRDFLRHSPDTTPGPLGGVMPHRLPSRLRGQIPDPFFTWVEACPVGVTLELTISAPTVVRICAYTLDDGTPHCSVGSRGTWRSREVTGAGRLIPDMAHHSFTLQPGTPMSITLEPDSDITADESRHATHQAFTVLLPHACMVECLSIVSDAPVTPTVPSTTTPRWTHYGSSISHGTQAVNPADRWPAQVANTLSLDCTDLSLSGNAQLDPAVARTMAHTPADIITAVIGINIVNADSMRERTFVPAVHGFLDTLRDGQPDTPIVLFSACSCPIQEETPGPVVMRQDGSFATVHRDVDQDDGALKLSRTRTLLEQIVRSRGDPHLTLIDGRRLLGPDDTGYLKDNLHPDQVGIDLIASRFAAILRPMIAAL